MIRNSVLAFRHQPHALLSLNLSMLGDWLVYKCLFSRASSVNDRMFNIQNVVRMVEKYTAQMCDTNGKKARLFSSTSSAKKL